MHSRVYLIVLLFGLYSCKNSFIIEFDMGLGCNQVVLGSKSEQLVLENGYYREFTSIYLNEMEREEVDSIGFVPSSFRRYSFNNTTPLFLYPEDGLSNQPINLNGSSFDFEGAFGFPYTLKYEKDSVFDVLSELRTCYVFSGHIYQNSGSSDRYRLFIDQETLFILGVDHYLNSKLTLKYQTPILEFKECTKKEIRDKKQEVSIEFKKELEEKVKYVYRIPPLYSYK